MPSTRPKGRPPTPHSNPSKRETPCLNDARSGRIVLAAHCLLNQNAKVAGLAAHPGVFAPLVPLWAKSGAGIIQLPCPECVHLGPARPVGSDTVEQYDTPAYRAACARLARRVAAETLAYRDAGYAVLGVLGVEGSPSCSVSRAPRLGPDGRARLVAGRGLFVAALMRRFKAAGLDIPFLGIPESAAAGDFRSALDELRNLLELEGIRGRPRLRKGSKRGGR